MRVLFLRRISMRIDGKSKRTAATQAGCSLKRGMKGWTRRGWRRSAVRVNCMRSAQSTLLRVQRVIGWKEILLASRQFISSARHFQGFTATDDGARWRNSVEFTRVDLVINRLLKCERRLSRKFIRIVNKRVTKVEFNGCKR